MVADPTARPTRNEQLQALLVAFVCAVVYLGPGLLPGRSLVPYPPEFYEPLRSEALEAGMSVEELGRGNLSMGDKYNQSLTWDRVIEERFRDGEFPLWTRDIGGGAPFVSQMGQPYEPWNVLLLIWSSTEWYGPVVLLQLVLIGWFAYRFFRRVDCRHSSALFGIVVVVLGLWMQGRIHQNVVISAALPLFLMLSCVHDLFGGRRVLRAIGVFAIGAGLTWSAGFAPVSLQITYVCLAFATTLAFVHRRARPLAHLGAALALGAVVSLAQMVPVLLAAAESAREHPTAELLAAKGADLANLASLVWPDLLFWPDPGHLSGRPSLMALLWLDALVPQSGAAEIPDLNYTEMVFSAGFVAMIGLAGLLGRTMGPLRERRAVTILFLAVALLGFGLASGASPFLELSAAIPGARTGDLRRFLFVVYMGVAVLSTFGVDRISRSGRSAVPRFVAGLAVVASLGLVWFGSGSEGQLATRYAQQLVDRYGHLAELSVDQVEATFAPGEVVANADRIFRTGARTALLGLLAIVALWRVRRYTVPTLMVLAAIELLHAGMGNRLAVRAERVERAPRVLGPVLDATAEARDGPRPRLMTLVGADERPPNGLASANLIAFWGAEHMGSYNPLPKRRMEEIWLAIEPDEAEGKESVRFGGGGSGVDALRRDASIDHPMLDVFGIEWILANRECASERLVDRTPHDVPGSFRLYERRGALPRATFVDRARVVEERDARLALLGSTGHDPRLEVVLEDPSAPAAAGDGIVEADVRVVLHDDELVRVDVDSAEAGYLRLADPFDRGWTATAADEDLDVFVADHYFRAVWLPAGRHTVEFRFDGVEVRLPRLVAFAGLLAAIGAILLGSRPARVAPVDEAAADA